jgi:predicted DNA-binding transcriptional regulator AlpA
VNFYDAYSMATQTPQPERTSHPRILGIEEVQTRLGCGRSSVYRLEKKGILHKAKQLAGCRTAGWLEDEVDAVVESRRPDRQEQAPIAKTGHSKTRGRREAEKATAPPPRSIEPAIANADERQDLVPTTLRIMGKVVYLHGPSGRLLMEVGKVSAPGPGLKLNPSTISGIQVGDDD